MAVQALATDTARNPRTLDEAKALVALVQSLFKPWNIDALVDGFTEDCVVHFGNVPQFTGRDALRAFFTARSARQKGYRLTKQLRSFTGESLTNIWDGAWQDAETGVAMKGFGVEFWLMRNGKIALWEAAFNVVRADQAPSVADALR